MNQWLEKILALRHVDFLELDRHLNILAYSSGTQRFAEQPDRLKIGEHSRIHFPELIGIEDILDAILVGEQAQFELRSIYRQTPNGEPLYFNFYAIAKPDDKLNRNHLVIFFEDATEQNVLEQKYVQITNELTLANQNLSAYKNYLQYIITYMADALLVTDSTGKISQCNQAAEKLLSASESELQNQSIHQIFQEVKLLPNLDNRALPNSAEQIILKNLEVNFTQKNGLNLTILFNCSAIVIEDRKHFVYIGRDITERKRAEKEMQIALQKERELNELKSNFLSMTSHEFRTPLTVVLSAAELLEFYSQKAADTPSLKYIDQIQTSVENMLELLDNLLLIGKADANKLTLQKSSINVENFCLNLVQELEIASQTPRISLVSESPGIAGRMDENLLRHILTNLLANALKYSSDGTSVYLRLRQESEAVTFEIEDRGIGISPEDQKHLFEFFHRGKNVANIPGTGLGLAIVQKSVEIYGGSLVVSSQVGVGTTFKVKLPLN